MTVYVDALVAYPPDIYRGKDAAQAKRVGGRNGHQWCHMFADEKDCPELHTMAVNIGLTREWFQGDHYDLTPGRGRYAVELGAVEVNREQAVSIWRKQRGPRV
jgi:hypothetical protein